ncbi:MAG: orotidine 5'-phosphate decarboxylase [Treponema sp.]|jgi:3-hexulose-6-phosphate synthase|nr:orotidine 5'-phosphate decarboxylase [Treponema sp.]
MKKLQAALDLFEIKAALNVLERIGTYIDIIELGTPLCISEGRRIFREVKAKYPGKIVFADIKIMDGGGVLSRLAFEAGADMVSVLAAAEDNTIRAAVECAKQYGGKVLVDMCSIKNMEERAKTIAALGPDYICCHVGYDIQAAGADPVEELRRLDCVSVPKAIAGGIRLENFGEALKSPAEVIIVGGGLYNQENMEAIAETMRNMLAQHG